MRILLIICALAISASARSITSLNFRGLQVGSKRSIGERSSPKEITKTDIRGGEVEEIIEPRKPPTVLQLAYSGCGMATAAAWTNIVLTTITSNCPPGALMPNWQHPTVNQISVLSAIPLMLSSFDALRSASRDSWEALDSPSSQRHNLALAVAGISSALWVQFADVITALPGTALSHASYAGTTRTLLLAAFASTAALSSAVWARSLDSPLSLPRRIADALSKALCNVAPADRNDPVNVKYSVLTAGFTVLTLLPLLSAHPLSVVPSWTGRRISRAFPAWTMLAAVTSYDLKESVEEGKVGERRFRRLARGLRAFGVVHVLSKIGAVFFDPSFPGSYHAVALVPGWAALATAIFSLTLRSDR